MMSWRTWLDNRIRSISSNVCAPKGVKVENRLYTLPAAHEPFAIPFEDPPLWHDGGFLDPAHPTRVTVPAGLSGRYHLIAAVRWRDQDEQQFSVDFSEGCFFVAWIAVNGDTGHSPRDSGTVDAPAAYASVTTQQTVLETALDVGDYIELQVRWHDAATGYPVENFRIEAWLTARRLCGSD
jgi:hypothetical protein